MHWFSKPALPIGLGIALACGAVAAVAQNLGPPGGGGGSGNVGTLTSVAIVGGTGISPVGACNSTSLVNCTINVTGAPYFRVRDSSAQALNGVGTPTKIAFDTVDFNNGSAWNVANHNFNPQVSGTYEICASAVISGTFALNTLSNVQIVKNSTVQVEFLNNAAAAVTTSGSFGGCGLVQLNGSSDTVEIDAASNAGTPTLNGVTNRTYMTGQLVGP